MLLESPNKVLVTHRRLFERDMPRFFVGEVLAYQDGIAKVEGYSFVRDVSTSHILRKDDRRTKLVSISSSAYIVYQLSDQVDVTKVEFEWTDQGLLLKAGGELLMNLAEVPHDGKI